MALKYLCFNLLILSSIFIIYAKGDQCLYEILVKTGTITDAGTDSKISLTLADSSRDELKIPNLEDWGTMPQGHDYFENGNLDSFGGVGPCLNESVCEIKLISDGTGNKPGWYCAYVEVSSFGVNKPQSKKHFVVDQWLALDEPPYELYAVKDECTLFGGKGANHGLAI